MAWKALSPWAAALSFRSAWAAGVVAMFNATGKGVAHPCSMGNAGAVNAASNMVLRFRGGLCIQWAPEQVSAAPYTHRCGERLQNSGRAAFPNETDAV
jgi:hypothetical protein